VITGTIYSNDDNRPSFWVKVTVKKPVWFRVNRLRLQKKKMGLPRIIPKALVFRLGMKAISNVRIKKSPVLYGGDIRGLLR